MLRPVYDPKQGSMNVVGLISGSGTRLIDLLEHQAMLDSAGGSPYKVVGVFSDSPRSKAKQIGERFNIPAIVRDLRNFCKQRDKKITDLNAREEFDRETVLRLAELKADVAVYAGYVWVATPPLVEGFIGVNGHPADLSVKTNEKRAYAGGDGIGAALSAGETKLFATTHLVIPEVDEGPLLVISKPVEVEQDPGMDAKVRWRKYLKLVNRKLTEIFPLTIENLASGNFECDDAGLMYFKGRQIPDGLRM